MTDSHDFELVRDITRGQFRHVLFDFDGTISLLREGWQAIMHPLMVEMICGDTPPTPDIEQRAHNMIDETTGIQTILQMEHLVALVQEYGLVPEPDMLDAQGYKSIYNDRLMVPVNERLDRLAHGDLSQDEASVAGSREFVARVAAQGPALYIFSGTNQDDVRNEANKLGVDHHFSEIWGALRTIKEFSKEKILTEMIKERNLSGPEVLIIGDGPVEIRLAHEHGCVSVGVASDEENGGLDPVKRERLIGVGADIIVPDFARGEALVEYLFAG
ncbi:MAG: HAD hydrolase-like protein [Candidatus Hydrogenedentota bacterium]